MLTEFKTQSILTLNISEIYIFTIGLSSPPYDIFPHHAVEVRSLHPAVFSTAQTGSFIDLNDRK